MYQKSRIQLHRLLVACVLLLFWAGTGGAAEVQVLPGDVPVKIHGRIGDDTTFVKRFGFITSAAIPELIFRSTDLVRTDGKERIGRQQVALTNPGKVDLAPSTPKDVEIKVTGIKLPGTYKGTLSFLQPQQGLRAIVTVPIEVTAEGVPKLTQRKGSEALKIQRFDCTWDCWIARWIQPSAFFSTYPLMFDNASLEEFSMTTAVNAIGDVTHSSLEKVLTVQSPVQVPVEPVFTLPIKFSNSNLLPDHYTGDVQLKMATETPPLKIPIEVNVRKGPFWPFITLLAGILFGRLLKYMKDKGTPQSDLLLNLYHLESRIKVSSPDDWPLLQPMLESVKALIYEMQLDKAKKEMTDIENRETHLNTLRRLESMLQPRASEAGVSSILSDIRKTRDFIKNKQDQQASALVAQIQTAVQNLPPPPPAIAAVHAKALKQQANKAVVDATRTVEGTAETPPTLVRFLTRITGIDEGLRAEFTLRVLRPILYVVLIGFLIIVGAQQLYLKNPTFGSDLFSDYFGLLVWAMSSDVASRTLASLKS